MRDYLIIRSFCSRCISSDFKDFHSACNFDIVRLSDKILPKNNQNAKFFKQITEHFFDKKRLMKFSKFRLIQPKFSFINLNYKQANFLLNLA
ncbi:hypothetical protein [Campylobacter concisus]|uniref:hypothetical protein n=1 Tax=Campylobacter concisus TaxID=199 RepID=UPI0011E78718|nr:hypothetical protein [Campylobacter concisus]